MHLKLNHLTNSSSRPNIKDARNEASEEIVIPASDAPAFFFYSLGCIYPQTVIASINIGDLFFSAWFFQVSVRTPPGERATFPAFHLFCPIYLAFPSPSFSNCWVKFCCTNPKWHLSANTNEAKLYSPKAFGGAKILSPFETARKYAEPRIRFLFSHAYTETPPSHQGSPTGSIWVDFGAPNYLDLFHKNSVIFRSPRILTFINFSRCLPHKRFGAQPNPVSTEIHSEVTLVLLNAPTLPSTQCLSYVPLSAVFISTYMTTYDCSVLPALFFGDFRGWKEMPPLHGAFLHRLWGFWCRIVSNLALLGLPPLCRLDGWVRSGYSMKK